MGQNLRGNNEEHPIFHFGTRVIGGPPSFATSKQSVNKSPIGPPFITVMNKKWLNTRALRWGHRTPIIEEAVPLRHYQKRLFIF